MPLRKYIPRYHDCHFQFASCTQTYKQTPGCGSTGQRKVTVCARTMRVLSNSEKSYLPLLGQTQDKNWKNCTQVRSLILYIPVHLFLLQGATLWKYSYEGYWDMYWVIFIKVILYFLCFIFSKSIIFVEICDVH